MKIQICGPGCANCTKAEKIVSETLAETGIDARMEKISEFREMAALGVRLTPAVVINGQIKCVGKVPTKDEVKSWLR